MTKWNGKMLKSVIEMRASGQKEMVTDGLVTYIPESQRVISVGDIHGDYKTVKHIIEKEQFIENMESGKKDTTIVFMGDIVDRGKKNPEVVEAILELKRRYPNNVVLMRADHEDFDVSNKYGGVPDLMRRYKDRKVVESLYREVFGRMPRLVVTGTGVVFSHGGPSPFDLNLQQMARIRDNNVKALFDEAMAWADPTTSQEIQTARAAHSQYINELDSLIASAEKTPNKKAKASFGNEYDLYTLKLLKQRVIEYDRSGAWVNLERLGYNNLGEGIYGAINQNLLVYSDRTVNNFLKKIGGNVLVRGHQTSDAINTGSNNVIGNNFLTIHSTGRGSEDSHYAVREWNPKYAVFDANTPVTAIDPNKNIKLVWPTQT